MDQEVRPESPPSRHTSGSQVPPTRSHPERSPRKPSVVLKPRDPSPAPEAPSEPEEQSPTPKSSPATPTSKATPPWEKRRRGRRTPPSRQRQKGTTPEKAEEPGRGRERPFQGRFKGFSKPPKEDHQEAQGEKNHSAAHKRVQIVEEGKEARKARSPTPPGGRRPQSSGILKASKYRPRDEDEAPQGSGAQLLSAKRVQHDQRQQASRLKALEADQEREKTRKPLSAKAPWWMKFRVNRRKTMGAKMAHQGM